MKVTISEPKPVQKTIKNKAGDYINTGEIVQGLSVVWVEAPVEASSLENVGIAAQTAQPDWEVRRIQGPYQKGTAFAYKVTLGLPIPTTEVENW